jgi:thymidylate synthase
MVYVIKAHSIKEARFKAVSLIMYYGDKLEDQRGDQTQEFQNLTIAIDSEECELLENPKLRLMQEDFANGLIDDDAATRKGNTFAYAYGHELREENGLKKTIDMLRDDPETRRAYIPMFKSRHIGQEDIPCFVGLDFIVRNDVLNMTATARSNCCVFGLPSDIYGFSMLQRDIAWKIGCDPGMYVQNVVSAHCRTGSDMNEIEKILHERY